MACHHNGMMADKPKARTIYLDDLTWDRLRQLAFDRHQTISEVLRLGLTPTMQIVNDPPEFRTPPTQLQRAPEPKPVPSRTAQKQRDEWLRSMSKEK
jgi:hypothetical protein